MIRTGYNDFSPIKWKQEFSVGASEIDSQHERLMTLYNDTLIHCSGNAAKEREYFDNNMEAFINLLAEHFDTEEQILSVKKYPQIHEHILDHLKLLEKMNLVKKEVRENNWKMYLHILAITLKDWLMYHFDSYDLSAKDYFRERDSIQPERKRQAVSA